MIGWDYIGLYRDCRTGGCFGIYLAFHRDNSGFSRWDFTTTLVFPLILYSRGKTKPYLIPYSTVCALYELGGMLIKF